ncbi:MAG: glycosyl hydrolase [Flavobacteriia bacterium]|nr:MAG: glycosyl hydrolase [Flavobacteriia bacterium]
MKKLYFLVLILFFSIHINSQESVVKNISFRSVGPSVMSGRVVDLDVNPANPSEFYVGYASGGVWYTNNNGTTFTPVMDNAPTQNVGDIAVDWKNGTIWVGTGENNSSRSSYAGIGVLKSTDKGKTWVNTGLTDSHHIGTILINPENPDEVVVGVTGHLYTPNKQRGIFKTTDGGKTWKNTLFINENTGIIDVDHVPGDFNLMYAAAWERNRKAWNFTGSGEGSAIYKSTDGGNSWQKVTTEKSGFPVGKGVGRIGVAAFDNNTVYAVVDNQNRRSKEKNKEEQKSNELKKEDFKTMDKASFARLDDKKLNEYLKSNGFPKKYNAKGVKSMVKSGKIQPSDLAKYLENANNDLFDTPVIGAEVYRSDDGGKTWKRTHKDFIDDLYYSYGYYFGMIHVNPQDKDKIYIYGVPLLTSNDGGKTFKSIGKSNVHVDHHALWINPHKKGHLINGNDGGVNITYDDGQNWIKNNQPSVGQFYSVNVDKARPYHVYGGLQDNGVWMGPGNNKESKAWHQTGSYPFKSIMGGDGMQVQIDLRNDSIVYAGYQFGNYFRINTKTKRNKYIQPKHDLGEEPYRFNWQSPILLSSHNKDILYFGSNKLHRSMNRGNDFVEISGDLTRGGIKGNVPYGTLSSISESPFRFGLLVTGSDDGLVQVSKDAGENWQNVSNGLPKDRWVSRVIASRYKKERIYAALNGYRNDDFKPYVFVSEDYGTHWKNINGNLPDSPVNVIKEDPTDENILYLGNDQAVYVSFNRGASWQILDNSIPKVAVHDLVIQENAKDLVIGTHGRSIYIADIGELQQYNKIKDKELEILGLENIRYSKSWGKSWSAWSEVNDPKLKIPFYISKAQPVTISIKDKEGVEVNSLKTDADKGFNFKDYDLTFSDKGLRSYKKKHRDIVIEKKKNGKYYLPKGEYVIEIKGVKKNFKIK